MTDQSCFTLRLFRQKDPFRPLASRRLEPGELAIGRDPGEGWVLDDPDLALSRRHCVLTLADGRLTLRDTSTNGVFVGPDRIRAPSDAPMEIQPGEAFRFGPYMMAVDVQAVGSARPALLEATFIAPARTSPSPAPSHAYREAVPAVAAPRPMPALGNETIMGSSGGPAAAALLDAFCEGAGLEASAFLGDDPNEVMRRVGAVYRQMVVGLTDLMDERTAVKGEYGLERTTVGAVGNNPFRWASADRVAIDLLRGRDSGFLTGSEAVTEAFHDLKTHLLCMLAGTRATVKSTLERLRPSRIEEQSEPGPFRRKPRAATAWKAYGRAHLELEKDGDDHVSRQFRSAYESELRRLDQPETRP